MPFIALYDANALYPNSQRDLLIRIARAGLVQAKRAWLLKPGTRCRRGREVRGARRGGPGVLSRRR